jgi:hypothetical protein
VGGGQPEAGHLFFLPQPKDLWSSILRMLSCVGLPFPFFISGPLDRKRSPRLTSIFPEDVVWVRGVSEDRREEG